MADAAKSAAELEHKLVPVSLYNVLGKPLYRAYTPQKPDKPKPIEGYKPYHKDVPEPSPSAQAATLVQTRQRAASAPPLNTILSTEPGKLG